MDTGRHQSLISFTMHLARRYCTNSAVYGAIGAINGRVGAISIPRIMLKEIKLLVPPRFHDDEPPLL